MPEEDEKPVELAAEDGTPAAPPADAGAAATPPAAAGGEKDPMTVLKERFPFVPHDQMPPMTEPRKMVYCPESGLPPDFCEYSGNWEVCKPWALANFPQYYPQYAGEDLAAAATAAAAKKAANASKEKELPGGKKEKKEKEPKLLIKVSKRQGKKKTTEVYGLDGYGVNLADAAKKFKKKFACGSAVSEGNPGQPDAVEIQGAPGKDELVEQRRIEVIKKEWKDVPYKKIEYVDTT